MARTDANPPMPEFRTDYVLQEVDNDYLTRAVKPTAIEESVGTALPGIDPRDHVVFLIDDDVCTRCALCVDRCPTGVIILGKLVDMPAEGDPHQRTNTHGYGYGMRLG